MLPDTKNRKKIKLVLEDGSTYHGYSFGADKNISGEVVFYTGMIGYPETLSDPGFKGQILVMTYPAIGNIGIPALEKDDQGILKSFESDNAQIAGLVITDYSDKYSHWSAEKDLSSWLKEQGIPAIYGSDTRAIAKKLREQGTMKGELIISDDTVIDSELNVNKVGVKKPVIYGEGKTKLILVDCGTRNNIIRRFIKRGVKIWRVPWTYDIFNSEYDYDGIIISGGPGSPKKYISAINTVKKALEKNIPLLGVGLGNLILALAAGAEVYKMRPGHRSQNQPSLAVGGKRCYITNQNHGFAVKEGSLPEGWKVSFININDNSIEGIAHKSKPWTGVQFYPDGSDMTDTEFIFDKFIESCKNGKTH